MRADGSTETERETRRLGQVNESIAPMTSSLPGRVGRRHLHSNEPDVRERQIQELLLLHQSSCGEYHSGLARCTILLSQREA